MNHPKIIFTDKAAPHVLKAFGKTINADGIIVDADGEPVLTKGWDEIHVDEFGGIKKGSEIYIKSDLPSVISLVEGEI